MGWKGEPSKVNAERREGVQDELLGHCWGGEGGPSKPSYQVTTKKKSRVTAEHGEPDCRENLNNVTAFVLNLRINCTTVPAATDVNKGSFCSQLNMWIFLYPGHRFTLKGNANFSVQIIGSLYIILQYCEYMGSTPHLLITYLHMNSVWWLAVLHTDCGTS